MDKSFKLEQLLMPGVIDHLNGLVACADVSNEVQALVEAGRVKRNNEDSAK